ncbi:MAG: type II toxin-antitoxin system VapC family toxin [Candidatus Heimdallarchaeota archaeon]|nr:MAG: type II toxin-antitoxin system VapC family toxin [Candidatus Heimdallarchaeota archaeon]
MPTLDTRFFIDFFGQKNRNKQIKLKKLAKQKSFVSVITLHELFKLFAETEGIPVAEHRLRIIQSTYDIIEITAEISISAARIRLHTKIPTADSLIGALALSKDKIVISDDPHFAMIQKLQVKWI